MRVQDWNGSIEWEVPEYPGGSWEIRTDSCTMTIERRPDHCDRGRFYVKAFPDNLLKMPVDDADRFPRYYFDFRCLLQETFYWLKERKEVLGVPTLPGMIDLLRPCMPPGWKGPVSERSESAEGKETGSFTPSP